jgi:hypothetical protein
MTASALRTFAILVHHLRASLGNSQPELRGTSCANCDGDDCRTVTEREWLVTFLATVSRRGERQ